MWTIMWTENSQDRWDRLEKMCIRDRIWTNILISLLAIAAAPCLFSAGFQTMVKRFLRLLFFFLERLDRI